MNRSILLECLFVCAFFASKTTSLTAIALTECGSSKGCFYHPLCESADASKCQFAVTWKPVTRNSLGYVEFELQGVLIEQGGYLAVGYSTTKSMEDSGMVICRKKATGPIEMVPGYAAAKTSPTLYSSADIDSNFFESTEGNFDGGSRVLTCRFTRLANPTKKADKLKQLDGGNRYYVLVASGQVSGSSAKIVQHQFRIISDTPEDLSKAGSLITGGGTGASGLAKAHGCLMVLAWVLCSSVGLILARYYKDMWPNVAAQTQRVWFQAHRVLMSICVILTSIAFILIFVHVGGYSALTGWPQVAHPILGIIVFILMFLNPLIALCRCHPGHKDRPWFNWIHFFVGTIAYVLSVPTIMIGLRLPGAGVQLARLDSPQWVMVFFVIFQFLTEIALEIHGCMYYRRNKEKRNNYQRLMEDFEKSTAMNSSPMERPRHPEPAGRAFRVAVICLHAIVVSIFAFVLVIMIAVN